MSRDALKFIPNPRAVNRALTDAKAYADTGDATTLASANAYADSVAGGGGAGDVVGVGASVAGEIPVYTDMSGNEIESSGETIASIIAAAGGGWQRVLTLDLTAEANQTIGSNGAFTFGTGLPGNKINSVNDATAMALVNGSGLVQIPGSTSDYLGAGTRNLPAVEILLRDINPNWNVNVPLRVRAYHSAENIAAQFDAAVLAIDNSTSNSAFYIKRVFVSGSKTVDLNVNRNSTRSNKFFNETVAAKVLALDVPNILRSSAYGFYANHSGTMPENGDLVGANQLDAGMPTPRSDEDATNSLDPTKWRILLGAQRSGSATALSITWARLEVDMLL